jgi:excisionase family DNA binding protein
MTFYTVPELEQMLKLSKSQIYALIEDGRMHCHRFTRGRNGAIRVSQAQLDEYLRATEETGAPDKTSPETQPASAFVRKNRFTFLPPRS